MSRSGTVAKTTRLGLYSLSIERSAFEESPRFEESGDPSLALEESLRAAAVSTAEFPFTEERHLIHVGRGTLRVVAERDERTNRYHDWAIEHAEPHFQGVPGADVLYSAFCERFDAAVPELTGTHLVAALHALEAEYRSMDRPRGSEPLDGDSVLALTKDCSVTADGRGSDLRQRLVDGAFGSARVDGANSTVGADSAVGARLQLVELCVQPGRGHQVSMAADLDDPPTVENDDHVGHAYGREPVRDQHRNAA